MRTVKKILISVMIFAGLGLSFLPVRAEAPKSIRYIAIGDSLTYGLGASEQNYLRLNAFVPRVVKKLRSAQPVYVENHGIPGITSTELNLFIQNDAGLKKSLASANFITVTVGGNDFLRILTLLPNANENSYAESFEQLKRQINQLHSTLRDINKRATIVYVGLYNPFPKGEQYYELGQRFAPAYNAQLKKLQDDQTIVVDPYGAFFGKELKLTHIQNNDRHPNDEGYGILAKLVIDAYQTVKSKNQSIE